MTDDRADDDRNVAADDDADEAQGDEPSDEPCAEPSDESADDAPAERSADAPLGPEREREPSVVLAILALASVVAAATFGLTHKGRVPAVLAAGEKIEAPAPDDEPADTASEEPTETASDNLESAVGRGVVITASTVTTSPSTATTFPGSVAPTSSTVPWPAISATTTTAPRAAATATTTPASTAPPITVSPPRTVTVSNRITNGMAMKEGPPLALVSIPSTPCVVAPGCSEVGGTKRKSGDVIVATCQADRRGHAFGTVSNGDDTTAADDANPGLARSALWYGINWNATIAYIPEVFIVPSQRGGLGLPPCVV